MSESGVNLEQGFDFDQISKDIGTIETKKMMSFVGIYSEEEIKEDVVKVWEAEKYFQKRNQMWGINKMGEKFGDNLEYVIDKSAEQNYWFGENSFVTKTLKYDDYINRVDFVLEYDMSEFDENPQRVAIMVDCTSSREKINRKISTNITSMELGKTRVKYFESQVDSFRGEVVCIPVVIGLDGKHVEQLLDNVKNNHYLERSPAQVVFLEEIKMQLRLYRQILSSKKGNYSNTLEKIENIQKIIGGVIDQKTSLANLEETKDYLATDDVCQEMMLVIGQKKENPRL